MNKHRANYIQLLTDNVLEYTNELADEAKAFVRAAADWMGYDLDIEDKRFVDGAKDRGIDFWYSTETGFDFIQVKSHLINKGCINLSKMNNSGVDDLRRIIDILKEDRFPNEANKKVQQLIKDWKMTISTKSMVDDPEPIEINIYLVIFADNLTNQALEEFDIFKKQNSKTECRNVPIDIHIHLITIDDLLENKWRQSNQDWKDKNGLIKNTINITPEFDKSGNPQWIPGHSSAIFYCASIDLVKAYSELGYQIFEPNVRAHINKSKVNAAIKKSLNHNSTRKNFKYLNNGVTMVCKTFSKPSDNKKCFTVTEPGIINGLQTVISLFDTYTELDNEEKIHFEDNCYVLLRILTENTFKDINKVVIATNTQNPMQARNLRSNNEEQIIFEKLFAEKKWFYERKQGAWDAYSSDPHRWRTLSSYKKANFQYENEDGGKRKKYRVVDNEQLAQSWLAFVGLSEEAMHRKRDLFDSDELYQLSFLQRPINHGYNYSFDRNNLIEECIDESPEPSLMISSYLAKEFSKIVPITTRQARENAINKLSVNKNQPRENIDVAINDEIGFLKARVFNSMSLIFVELFGYVLFKSFGKDVYSVGKLILKTDSLNRLHLYGNLANIDSIRSGEIVDNDILSIIWHAFDHIIDEMLGGAWKESFLSAFPRSRHAYKKETRSRIFRSMDELDKFMTRAQLTKIWASSIPANIGFYQNIRRIIKYER